ncbi:hypothetical protein GGTG_12121 [Gaeumannomyces tritici R3-111a-1]|uniref:Uncharacterized protein n=1 Tax=Gaeumannomyces tritici (strain R3-111a-1) TaxID=644352 RepID=J3PF42_GAET3|nr:hypothetical protein GGTG_12121 [Gaeumannomyces tritici R3-111a-1]EJT71100.1 hypothetical protein GGTG_12121 [Gaeumannomyces tritici R3-111a-1]
MAAFSEPGSGAVRRLGINGVGGWLVGMARSHDLHPNVDAAGAVLAGPCYEPDLAGPVPPRAGIDPQPADAAAYATPE